MLDDVTNHGGTNGQDLLDQFLPLDPRSGCGVDVHVMSPAGQAAGQVGHERLRPAKLRLAAVKTFSKIVKMTFEPRY